MSESVTSPVLTNDNDETRQRILDASEAIFAEIGYEAATVRAICERANVKNIGAVNYYFQGKENLYRETVKNALRTCSEGAPFPDWPEDKRWLIGFSVVGQCLYYRQNRAVAEILMGAESIAKLDVDLLAEHIAAFSLAALGFAAPVAVTRGTAGGTP